MGELTDLSVAEAAAKIAAGAISAAEYSEAWRAAAASDELNAYLWTAEHGGEGEPDWTGDGESAPEGEGLATPYGANPPAPADSGPLAGVPIAIKDIFTTQGIPTTAGSRILEGYRPPYTATAVNKLTAAGAQRPRQDQHGRVRDGFLERELGLRSGAQPVGPRPRSRRLLGRLGGGGRGWARPGGARHRHRRLDPPARRALRHRRPQTDLRGDLALRHDRLRLLARPVRAADPRRHRRGAAPLRHAGEGPARLDLGRDRGRDRAARPRGPQGPALRRPAGARRGGPRRRRACRLRGDRGADRGARRRDRRDRLARTPSTASPPTT